MLRIGFIVILSAVFTFYASAQSKGSSSRKKSSAQERQSDSPTSLQPYFPEKDYVPEAEKKSRKKIKQQPITYDARERFYERMEEVAKQRRKNEKLMEKPQYSDPMYFGHKRPPKKRPPEKMKYCKVCGIRH
ncbi:MAG: hypothetical protein NZM13_03465 [Cyclobacteriaceae bacterium]|nr:hypothetical protein [Cyclobacteriaceae bacterium]MDW8331240.1 hypothetical protein [Cyclobacteriaceae bacterium]